jgi:hypothetical protein
MGRVAAHHKRELLWGFPSLLPARRLPVDSKRRAHLLLVTGLSVLLGGSIAQAKSQDTLIVEVLRSGTPAKIFQDSTPTPKELDDAATPIVEFDSAVPVGRKRARKSAQFDNLNFVHTDPGAKIVEVVLGGPSQVIRTLIPSTQSDLVVEAQIIDAAAYLSNDKGAVYSEFSARMTSILRAAPGISVARGDKILLEHLGGRIKYSSGKIVRYRKDGNKSLMKGKKYVLFLSKSQYESYTILAAYEANGRRPQRLDRLEVSSPPGHTEILPRDNRGCRKEEPSLLSSVGQQTTTCTASPPTSGKQWRQGSSVDVYIDPSITGAGRYAAMEAFNNWNAASGPAGNNSGVTFNFVSSPPSSGTGFRVSYGTPPGGERAHISYNYNPSNNFLTDASVTVSPVVTDYDAMLETMSHEIAHSFGMEHCEECSVSSSVMAATPIGSNWNSAGGRPTSPTECDNQALKSASYPSGNGGGGSGGGGGGGGEDPGTCTHWFWVTSVSHDHGATWEVTDIEYLGCW